MFDDPRPEVTLGDIAFKSEQPNISVKTKNIVEVHEYLPGGGSDSDYRVQKLGEKPVEIGIKGICSGEEAQQIDDLVEGESAQLVSNRWEGEVVVMSTSTDPLADGGAIDKDIDFIHNFDITCKGIDGGAAQGGSSVYFRGHIDNPSL